MVVMVHNSDIPDPWEREGEDTDYFFKFSPEAYAVGIDVVLYHDDPLTERAHVSDRRSKVD